MISGVTMGACRMPMFTFSCAVAGIGSAAREGTAPDNSTSRGGRLSRLARLSVVAHRCVCVWYSFLQHYLGLRFA